MVIVNIVSQIPAPIWVRESPENLLWDFVHTASPVPADVHVIYGLRSPIVVPNSRENTIFVASEPPEIRHYNLKVLAQYKAVLAPGFDYLRSLPNFREITAIAPWWAGSRAGGRVHYDPEQIGITLSREDFEIGVTPGEEILSVITSSKARTPLQQQRLRLIDYLSRHISTMEVFGPNYRDLEDKADALRRSKYHLAVENSSHSGYWTEKFSDPVLLDNVVFYHGDPNIHRFFSKASVLVIDPYDSDATYRKIVDAMDNGAWDNAAEARHENRRLLLESLSFHRAISEYLVDQNFSSSTARIFAIPAQQPVSRVKRLLDPFYRVLKRMVS